MVKSYTELERLVRELGDPYERKSLSEALRSPGAKNLLDYAELERRVLAAMGARDAGILDDEKLLAALGRDPMPFVSAPTPWSEEAIRATYWARFQGETDERFRDRMRVAQRSSLEPIPKSDVMAELTYEFGGKRWSARVRRDTSLELGPHYALEIESGGHTSQAGTFCTGKALAKFVREKAERYKGYTPTVDTLKNIVDRTPGSIVPDCYQGHQALTSSDVGGDYDGDNYDGVGRGKPECPACPWRSRCGETTAQLCAAQKPEELESEEDRLKKLRDYVKAKWGDYKPDEEG